MKKTLGIPHTEEKQMNELNFFSEIFSMTIKNIGDSQREWKVTCVNVMDGIFNSLIDSHI